MIGHSAPAAPSATLRGAGLGLWRPAHQDETVFGPIEGTIMSDQSCIGTAKGGVRVAL